MIYAETEASLIECIAKDSTVEIKNIFSEYEMVDYVFQYSRPPLKKNKLYISQDQLTVLVYVILQEKVDILKEIVSCWNCNSSNFFKKVDGRNCIHYACVTQGCECLKFLLTIDIVLNNLDAPTDDGLTPLLIACNNSLDHASLILNAKGPPMIFLGQKTSATDQKNVDVNVNAATRNGMTPLHIATYKNNRDLVNLLRLHHPDVTIKNNSGKNPLEYAKELGHREQLYQMLEEFYVPLPVNSETEVKLFNGTESETQLNAGIDSRLAKIESSVSRLAYLVSNLQSNNYSNVTQHSGSVTREHSVIFASQNERCCVCKSLNSTKCSICYKFYCSVCMMKELHSCICN